MKLEDIASIRTGLVTGRKRSLESELGAKQFKLLNLKCMTENGIDPDFLEDFYSTAEVKSDFLTRNGDILIRLSAPYTSAMIYDQRLVDVLIPSHFAIVRIKSDRVTPDYVLWSLRRAETMQLIQQNNSGSSGFGTISSGFIASLPIEPLPIHQQRLLGELTTLAEKEYVLLQRLSQERKRLSAAYIENTYEKMKRGNEI